MRPILTDRVAWSVCLSVCHTSEPCKNGCTDRAAFWVEDVLLLLLLYCYFLCIFICYYYAVVWHRFGICSLRRHWKVQLWRFTDVTVLSSICYLHFGDNSLSFSQTSTTLLVMVALCNRADHYIFILFLLLLSSFFFFSSPNLSSRRLDVYHTLAHGVVLV